MKPESDVSHPRVKAQLLVRLASFAALARNLDISGVIETAGFDAGKESVPGLRS